MLVGMAPIGAAVGSRSAFPEIMGVQITEGTGTGTPMVFDLPSAVQVGELLLMFGVYGQSSARTVATPSGWDELYNIVPAATANFRRSVAFFRFATGSEGSTVDVSASAGAHWSGIIYRIANATAAPEYAMVNSDTNDPPNLSPTWPESNSLWLAGVAGYTGSSVYNPPVASPSGYSTYIFATSQSGNNAQVGFMSRQHRAASENPGAYSFSAATPHMSITVGVRGVG